MPLIKCTYACTFISTATVSELFSQFRQFLSAENTYTDTLPFLADFQKVMKSREVSASKLDPASYLNIISGENTPNLGVSEKVQILFTRGENDRRMIENF